MWNFAAKRASGTGTAFVWLYSAVAVVLYTSPVIWLGVTGRIQLDWPIAGAIAVSSLGQLTYYLLLQKAYDKGDLSVVYPVARGSGPLLLVFAAVLLLGERPGPVGLLGAVVVVAGVLVVGTGRAGTDGEGSTRRLTLRADVAFGLAAGALVAACNLWDARTVSMLAVSPVLLEWVFNTTRVVVLAPGAFRQRSRLRGLWRDHHWQVVAVGVLMPLSYMLALWAFTVAPISLVAPVREFSIVVACVLAWWLLREPQPGRRLLGASLVLAGVIALAVAH